jgi:hypothetical protein
MDDTDSPFMMDEPRQIAMNTDYGFWLTTEHENVLDIIAAMGCVAAVLEVEDGRFLVEISDDHDPDEAWHWIRSELEDALTAVPDVELDPIWEEAIK